MFGVAARLNRRIPWHRLASPPAQEDQDEKRDVLRQLEIR